MLRVLRHSQWEAVYFLDVVVFPEQADPRGDEQEEQNRVYDTGNHPGERQRGFTIVPSREQTVHDITQHGVRDKFFIPHRTVPDVATQKPENQKKGYGEMGQGKCLAQRVGEEKKRGKAEVVRPGEEEQETYLEVRDFFLRIVLVHRMPLVRYGLRENAANRRECIILCIHRDRLFRKTGMHKFSGNGLYV